MADFKSGDLNTPTIGLNNAFSKVDLPATGFPTKIVWCSARSPQQQGTIAKGNTSSAAIPTSSSCTDTGRTSLVASPVPHSCITNPRSIEAAALPVDRGRATACDCNVMAAARRGAWSVMVTASGCSCVCSGQRGGIDPSSPSTVLSILSLRLAHRPPQNTDSGSS